jgi:arsenite methyltransferase
MNKIKLHIKSVYSGVAKDGNSCCGTGSKYEEEIGYTKEELESLPEGAALGVGCGNPVAIASLKEGETVLDLGSGAGIDVFLAAARVGSSGRVIGVDMTPEMLERARANAAKGGFDNVEFRKGEIEDLPVEDGTVDCIISNCVINLSVDKDKTFSEAFRVLKPGGRLMVSDIVLTKPLPPEVAGDAGAYSGCVSGAMLIEDYLAAISRAGFKDVRIISKTDASFLAGNLCGCGNLTDAAIDGLGLLSVKVGAKRG